MCTIFFTLKTEHKGHRYLARFIIKQTKKGVYHYSKFQSTERTLVWESNTELRQIGAPLSELMVCQRQCDSLHAILGLIKHKADISWVALFTSMITVWCFTFLVENLRYLLRAWCRQNRLLQSFRKDHLFNIWAEKHVRYHVKKNESVRRNTRAWKYALGVI